MPASSSSGVKRFTCLCLAVIGHAAGMSKPELISITFRADPVAPADGTPAAAPVRLRGVAYSGGVVPAYRWYQAMAIDVSTLSFPERARLLADHNDTLDGIAGHARVWAEAGQVMFEAEVIEVTTAGKTLAALVRAGVPVEMSLGIYGASTWEADLPEPRLVNGRNLTIDALLTGGSVREVSAVALGADPNTEAAAFAARHRNEEGPDVDLEQAKARIAELEAQSSAATAELSARTAERDSARAELATVQTAARTEAVRMLFRDTGRDFTEAAAAPYMALPADAFAVLAADLRACSARSGADPALFREQATGGAASADPERDQAVAAMLRGCGVRATAT